MIVFIDEAGPFASPGTAATAISCAGALVVPDTSIDSLLSEFKKLKAKWDPDKPEIKGSELTEDQAARLIDCLSKLEVGFVAVATDLNPEIVTPEQVTEHKRQQAEKFKTAIEKMNSEVRASWEELARRVAELSNPLYVQSVAMSCLVDEVIRFASLYYVQRVPAALGSFVWIVDAKDKVRTEYEDLWKTIVKPFLQTRSLQKPLVQLESADYSAMDKFVEVADKPPTHLEAFVEDKKAPFRAFSVNSIMEKTFFSDSKVELGLQIVDALVAICRRSLRGSLQRSGWENFGKLFIPAEKGSHVVRIVTLGDRATASVPYAGILKHFDQTARSMLV